MVELLLVTIETRESEEEADDLFYHRPVLHCGSYSLHGWMIDTVVAHSQESWLTMNELDPPNEQSKG